MGAADLTKGSDDTQIEVYFRGPRCWGGSPDCSWIFEDPRGLQPGVYLWTVESDRGHMVFYVGMTTRSFSVRIAEHLQHYLSGKYTIHDISQFREGRREVLWEGMGGVRDRYPEFVSRRQELWPHLSGMIKAMRFHLGPVKEADERVLKRIEAAIALNLRGQSGSVGDFQDPGIYYPPRNLDETPIHVSVRSNVPILGLPGEVQA